MSATRALSGVIVPIYLVRQGFNAGMLGELFALVAIVSAVMAALIGLLADRLGRKIFIVSVPLLAAGAALVFSLTHNVPLLFVTAALGSFGRGAGAGAGSTGPYQPAEQALIADSVPAAKRNSIFGRLAFASSLGAVIGAPLAVIPQLASALGMSSLSSYRPAFWVMALLACVAGLIVLPIRDVRPARTGSRQPFRLPHRSWWLLYRLWATNTVNGLAVGFFGPFITYWFYRRFGVSAAEIGLLYTVINLASMVSNLSAASIAGRFGVVRAIVLSRIISALLLVAMVLAPTFWLAGAIYLVRMVAQRVSLPLRQSYVMGVAIPEERAGVAALSNLPSQGSSALSPMLAGYIFAHISLALPFELGSLFQTINGVLYYAFFRNLHPPDEEIAVPPAHLRTTTDIAPVGSTADD